MLVNVVGSWDTTGNKTDKISAFVEFTVKLGGDEH